MDRIAVTYIYAQRGVDALTRHNLLKLAMIDVSCQNSGLEGRP